MTPLLRSRQRISGRLCAKYAWRGVAELMALVISTGRVRVRSPIRFDGKHHRILQRIPGVLIDVQAKGAPAPIRSDAR